jgi:uncharacterized protein (TIGR03437 family)
LGPLPGVTAPDGAALPTTLGGTQVTFDGTPAPLYFASGGFVAVQAPTTLAPGHTTSIMVTTATGSTLPVAVPIVNTNPGVFTADAGGQGLANAINQDGTQNGDGTITGSDTAAPPGSIVAVYATGLGPVLGYHLKTGHTLSLQNRPTDHTQDQMMLYRTGGGSGKCCVV